MLFNLRKARVPSLFQYLSPVYAAAVVLIIIQAGSGFLYRYTQHHGGYAFSPSSSLAISELLKFILSACFFYRECSRRRAHSRQRYPVVESRSSGSSVEEKSSRSEELPLGDLERSESSTLRINPQTKMRFSDFIFYVLTEVSTDTHCGFLKLALLYALINNMTFILYTLADPGTTQLIKSGLTLVAALVLWLNQGSNITKFQCIAIMFQVCGLAATQYDPTTGLNYPFTTYLVLILQTLLSAVAGVYNQKLCKREGASLHADNMVLYATGCCSNILIHIMTRFIKPSEPGFFIGYDDWKAIMVIISNAFIGLAVAAAYTCKPILDIGSKQQTDCWKCQRRDLTLCDCNLNGLDFVYFANPIWFLHDCDGRSGDCGCLLGYLGVHEGESNKETQCVIPDSFSADAGGFA